MLIEKKQTNMLSFTPSCISTEAYTMLGRGGREGGKENERKKWVEEGVRRQELKRELIRATNPGSVL